MSKDPMKLYREYQERLKRDLMKQKPKPTKPKARPVPGVVSEEALAKEKAFTEFQRIKKGGTLVRQPLNDCDKVKAEAKVLLKNPHKILAKFRKGYAGELTREFMALWRLNQVSENIFYQLKRAYPQEVKDVSLTRRRVKKVLGISPDTLVKLGKQMLTPEEKQQIYTQQQKMLEQYRGKITFTNNIQNYENELPTVLLLTPEEVQQADPDAPMSACVQINAILQLTVPDLLVQQYPELFQETPKAKRKPSGRNLFIGDQTRAGLTMKEASDKWATLSDADKQVWKDQAGANG